MVDMATHFLRFLNLIVLAGGVASIVIMLIIRPVPLFPPGWGFILLGALTVASGLLGVVSAARPGFFFDCHVFCLLVSLAGFLASFLVIFLRLDVIVGNLSPAVESGKARQLVSTEGAIYLVLFVTQLVVLLLAAIVQCCGAADYSDAYESISPVRASTRRYEEPRRPRMEARAAPRMPERPSEAPRRWIPAKPAEPTPPAMAGGVEYSGRVVGDKTQRMAEQLQQKYAHWVKRDTHFVESLSSKSSVSQQTARVTSLQKHSLASAVSAPRASISNNADFGKPENPRASRIVPSAVASEPAAVSNSPNAFHTENGYLYVEDMRVADVAEQIWQQEDNFRPFYLYSRPQILRNYNAYVDALKGLPGSIIGYAVKSNNNLKVLQTLCGAGSGAVLVSGNELRLALLAGFDPSTLPGESPPPRYPSRREPSPPRHPCVLNGNGKQQHELELAAEHGCLINIDSEFDLEHVTAAAEATGKVVNVLLRINPDVDPQVHAYVATGNKSSKFGIRNERLRWFLDQIRAREGKLRLVGAHCHLGSTITKVNVFRDAARIMVGYLDEIRAQGFPVQYLNIGVYSLSLAPLRILLIGFAGFGATLAMSVLRFSPRDALALIISRCAPSLLPTPMAHMPHRHTRAGGADAGGAEERSFDVVGPCASPLTSSGKAPALCPHLLRSVLLPATGDALVVHDAGAYCMAMASTYNLKMRPPEYWVEELAKQTADLATKVYSTSIDVAEQVVRVTKPLVEAAAPVVIEGAQEALKAAAPVASDLAEKASKALQDSGVDVAPVVEAARPIFHWLAVAIASHVSTRLTVSPTHPGPHLTSPRNRPPTASRAAIGAQTAASVADGVTDSTGRAITAVTPYATSTVDLISSADPTALSIAAGGLFGLYLLLPSIGRGIAYSFRGYAGAITVAAAAAAAATSAAAVAVSAVPRPHLICSQNHSLPLTLLLPPVRPRVPLIQPNDPACPPFATFQPPIFSLPPAPSPPSPSLAGELTAAQALDVLEREESVLVDVRSEDQKLSSGVPSLPRGLSRKIIYVPDNEISKQVARSLASLGYRNVWVVRDGVEGRAGWAASQLAIDSYDGPPTSWFSVPSYSSGGTSKERTGTQKLGTQSRLGTQSVSAAASTAAAEE
ncbi:unnamed protein product [Closterium sp. NIES-64]|nr:unnamed protein product [Closterium sp. NIES-64]